MNDLLTIWDFILLPFYLMLIYFLSNSIKNKHIEEKPYYRYYLPGLWLKILGGIILTLIYIFYYKGGDTINYFNDAVRLNSLFYEKPFDYLRILFTGFTPNDRYNLGTNYIFDYSDKQILFMIRIVSPFLFFTFKSFILSVVMIAWVSYIGIWRFYTLFCENYPKYYKQLSIGALFIPSVAFWGSGILKDTFTLMAATWFTYNFFCIFIKKEKITANLIMIIINSFLMISIKPYIIIALIPGSIIWLSFNWIKSIENRIVRIFAAPLLISIGLLFGLVILNVFSDSLGAYSSGDKIFRKAKITQQDLIRGEQYGKNFHNIGEFDENFSSVITKAPEAIIAGLFRPFIWEASNPVMLISGIENLIFLILTLYLGFYVGPFGLIKFISKDPLIFFSLTFAIIFAFSVGLTTANYGAMVRYRIPALPFFINGLILIYSFYREENKIKIAG